VNESGGEIFEGRKVSFEIESNGGQRTEPFFKMRIDEETSKKSEDFELYERADVFAYFDGKGLKDER
jgi:hypothetical protein